MQMEMDKQAFGEMVIAASELYGKKLSRYSVDMLFTDLAMYTIDQVREAFQAHRRDPVSGKFFPLTADFVKHIEGLPLDRAQQAWMTVFRAIKSHGRWESVVFDDRAIHVAIASMGGWIKLCSKTDDDMQFAKNDFVKLYTAAAKDNLLLESAPRYLIGEISLHNNQLGEAVNIDQMVFIGNRSKCLQIAKSPSTQQHPALAGVKLKSITD